MIFAFHFTLLAALTVAGSYAKAMDDSVQVPVQVVLKLSEAQDGNLEYFVAGNLPAIGSWSPDGLRFKRNAKGQLVATFTAPANAMVEYKLTKGTWGTVEKDATGGEIANRRLKVQSQLDGLPQRVEVSVPVWGGQPAAKSTVTGTLILHTAFGSTYLKQPRTIAIWLPPSYADSTDRYPVLYLHDGQNLFDASTAAFGTEWNADETATDRIEQNRISPVILVGIWNTPDRIMEYTPTFDKSIGAGGSGDAYVHFLVEELKPFIDRSYRTRPDRKSTVIGGSSLGGLISLYACEKSSSTFSGCAAISPTLGWDDEAFLKGVEQSAEWVHSTRIWLDMGSKEGKSHETQTNSLVRANRFADILRGIGKVQGKVQGKDLHVLTIPDGQHNEAAWSKRFGDVLEFFFGAE